MPAKVNPVRIEETLMKELRFGGIDKENLKELVTIIAGLRKRGLRRFKVFPKGIPVVDRLTVSGVMDASEITGFLTEMLPQTARLGRVVVFPYGIPWPEIFRVDIDLGSPVEREVTGQF